MVRAFSCRPPPTWKVVRDRHAVFNGTRSGTGSARRGSSTVSCRSLALLSACLLLTAGPAIMADAAADGAAPDPRFAEMDSLLIQGRYAQVEDSARRLAAERAQLHGAASPEVASALDYLVDALIRSGRFGTGEADSLSRAAVAAKTAAYGETHLETARSRYFLGWLRLQLGDLDEAAVHLEASLAVRRSLLAADHPDLAVSVNGLGALHYYKGDFEGAAVAFEEALAIREAALDDDDPRLAVSYQNLASLIADRGDLDRAEALYRRALDIRRRRLGDEAPPTLETQYNLSVLMLQQGKYLEAWSMARRVLALWRADQGDESYDVAICRHTLALILEKLGDYDQAAREMSEVTGTFETLLGPEHPELSAFLLAQGVLQYKTGDFNAARASLERARAHIETTLGGDHPRYGLALLNLGSLHRDMGDVNEALVRGEAAVRALEAAYGSEHSLAAEARMAQAGHLLAAGRPEASAAEIERAIGILRSSRTEDHPELGRALEHLAASLAQAGDLDGARALLDQAYGFWRDSVGPDHPATATVLYERGDLSLMAGRPEEAVVDLVAADRIVRDVYGEDHPLLGVVRMKLAEARLATRRPAEALAAALAAERIGRGHLRLSMRLFSEREALMYARRRAAGLDAALSVLTMLGPDAGVRDLSAVYAELINSRALVQDEMILRSRGLHRDVPAPQLALVRENQHVRAQLAHLIMREPQADSPEVLRRQLDFARREKERTERELARLNLDAGAEHVPEITPAALANALRDGERIVSFCRYGLMTPSAGDEAGGSLDRRDAYAAFVLSPGRPAPALIPLGDADTIAAAVSAWHEEAARGERRTDRPPHEALRAYHEAADRLRELLWDRVAPRLAGAEVVYVVPDGDLHLVNPATLTLPDGGYLVESGPEIRLLSAERDLLRVGTAPGRGLLVVGDPDYDGRPDPTSGRPGSGVLRGTERGSDCHDLAERHWGRLPATRGEAEAVCGLWRERSTAGDGAEPVELLLGLEASEHRFKAGAAGRRILHVASHGFFLSPDCAESGRDSLPPGGGIAWSRPSLRGRILTENPLLLSGLVLAGANRRDGSGAAGDDGILTAEEIAGLDLSGVRWAVLSACDTGRGEYRPGEGIMGLSRAFRIAGVDRLVLSLWPVDDAQARRWMSELYGGSDRPGDGDEPFSVWRTMRRLLSERRRQGVSTHPGHWGAFVSIGVPGREARTSPGR